MDKTMLLMMLAQQAPRLLSALKRSPSPNIEEALNRGYDAPLIEESVPIENPLSLYTRPEEIMPFIDQEMGRNLNGNPNFPSGYQFDLDPSDSPTVLQELYDSQTEYTGNKDALSSASSMLLQDPNIGLPTFSFVRKGTTLNDRINAKALDNALGMNLIQSSNPENERFAHTNPQAAIDSNYTNAVKLGFVDPGFSPEDEQDIKKRMYKMLTTGKIWV